MGGDEMRVCNPKQYRIVVLGGLFLVELGQCGGWRPVGLYGTMEQAWRSLRLETDTTDDLQPQPEA